MLPDRSRLPRLNANWGKETGDRAKEETKAELKPVQTDLPASADPTGVQGNDEVYVSLRDVTLINTERVLRLKSSSGYVTLLQNALNRDIDEKLSDALD